MTDANKSTQQQKQYSKKFFRKTFPPNHNPLIGTLQGDTLQNVHDAIALLQELTINSDDGLMPSDSVNMGYYLLMNSVLSALRFELYNRNKK